SKVKSVVISEGVASIDARAFHGCTSLVSIVMPSSIASIGRDIFNGCTHTYLRDGEIISEWSLIHIFYKGSSSDWAAVNIIDDSYFLSAAMMDILMYDDLSVYPANFDVISIPLQDVLLRARRMFGAEYSPVPVTLRIAGEFFYYDEDIHSYNVPQSPAIFAYAPQIQKIQRSGDVYTVDVLYVSDSAQWQEHSSNYTAQNEKEMQVVLEKKNGVWRIVRIANTGDAADQS
ncbi:MAG: leucine-rich repeat protein, partial [Oscillospiraceae bacterium]|nr:leucine-rich repeat protein [Oscillospiraceae bacterium]